MSQMCVFVHVLGMLCRCAMWIGCNKCECVGAMYLVWSSKHISNLRTKHVCVSGVVVCIRLALTGSVGLALLW